MNTEWFLRHAADIVGARLNERQVASINAILAEADRRKISNSWLAYILATAQGESSLDYSKRENMNYSAKRIGQAFERLRGRESELARKPTALANAAYSNMNGNGSEASGDGWRYRGAGLVQLTWKDNYTKFGLSDRPEMAATLEYGVPVLFDGMINGLYTGVKLADFTRNGAVDFMKARRIVNGTFEAAKYASWAESWYGALLAAGRKDNIAGEVAPGKTNEPAPRKSLLSILISFLKGK